MGGLFVSEMVVGKTKLHKRVVDGQCFQKSTENGSLKVTKVEVQIEDSVTILLAFLGLKHITNDIH